MNMVAGSARAYYFESVINCRRRRKNGRRRKGRRRRRKSKGASSFIVNIRQILQARRFPAATLSVGFLTLIFIVQHMKYFSFRSIVVDKSGNIFKTAASFVKQAVSFGCCWFLVVFATEVKCKNDESVNTEPNGGCWVITGIQVLLVTVISQCDLQLEHF